MRPPLSTPRPMSVLGLSGKARADRGAQKVMDVSRTSDCRYSHDGRCEKIEREQNVDDFHLSQLQMFVA